MASPIIQFKRGAFANLPALQAGEPALTTDTYELYVGIDSTTNGNKFFGSHRYWTRESSSTGSGVNLVEGTSNGSQYLTLKAPDTLSGIATYVFPDTTDGTAGDFLKLTSTTGNIYSLEWASIPSGSFSIAGDTGTDTFTTGETLTFVGGTNVNTAVTNNTVTINLDDNISITNLNATGVTTLSGNITLGDNTSDDITVGGEFVSSLNPSTTNSYDLGTSSQRWRNAWFSGNVSVAGILTATSYNDLLIANKDAVFGYIDGVSETDDTANHGGIAVASAQGTPLFDISVAGINTLPSTYKQLMWVKSGTFTGLSTDAWMFNYGVSIGTSTMASGVRLAVGTGVTVADTSVSATTFYGALSGTATTAVTAQNVAVVGVATNQNYYVTLVDGSGTSKAIGVDSELLYNPNTNTFKVGTGVGVTQFSGSVSTGSSTSSVPTSSAVIDYVTTQVGNVDVTLGLSADSGGPSTVSTAQTLTISGTANEVNTSVSGQTVTVGLPDAVSVTTSLTTPTVKATNVQANDGTTAITITNSTGAVATNSDLTVGGNLYINGSTTQVNTTSLTVEDSLVELGFVNGAAPSSDLNIDLGILFNYYTTSAKKAAVYWDDSASRIAVASDVSESSSVLTASAYAALEIGALWVNDCAGQSQVISCSGSTRNLENITIDAGTF